MTAKTLIKDARLYVATGLVKPGNVFCLLGRVADALEAAEAQAARYREALEYYATDCREKSKQYLGDVLGYDMGKRARAALKGDGE